MQGGYKSLYYKGDHSLTFYDIDYKIRTYSSSHPYCTKYNTWTDFHMAPTSRPVFNPPPLKSTYIEVPYRDGAIDLTTNLGYAKAPIYGNRTGTWEFIIPASLSDYPNDYRQIVTALHGLEKKIISDDDPNWYYQGRITLDNWQSNTDGSGNTVTLGYTLEPYKYCVQSLSVLSQRWDEINFGNGYINDSVINGEIFDSTSHYLEANTTNKVFTFDFSSKDTTFLSVPSPFILHAYDGALRNYSDGTQLMKIVYKNTAIDVNRTINLVAGSSNNTGSFTLDSEEDFIILNRDSNPTITFTVTTYNYAMYIRASGYLRSL